MLFTSFGSLLSCSCWPAVDVQRKVAAKQDSDTKSNDALFGVRTTVDEPMEPQEALQVLKSGNSRFVNGTVTFMGLDAATRSALVRHGQRPVATIIGCADSRCPLEQIFDSRPGDLFVLRNAGNTCMHAEGSIIGSVEYSLSHLEVRMIVVLGHTSCGAIMGATKLFQEMVMKGALEGMKEDGEKTEGEAQTQIQSPPSEDREDCPSPVLLGRKQRRNSLRTRKQKGTLHGLLSDLAPVAQEAFLELDGETSTEKIAAHAVRVNIFKTMDFLLGYSNVVREMLSSGSAELHGAIYDMESGQVIFLGQSPQQQNLLGSSERIPPSMQKD